MTTEPVVVDLAIVNATLVTVDDHDTIVDNGQVLITDGSIVHAGLARAHRATVTIDAEGGIAMPGMVNAHAHLAMTMFRGLADDRDLDAFLARLLPVEAVLLDPETIAIGTRLALAESLRAGITATADMYFLPEVAHQIAAEAGVRLHSGPVMIEFPGPDHRDFEARIEWAADMVSRPSPGLGSQRWLAPHSTYLLTEPQLRAVGELAERSGARVHVHAAETAAEVDQVQQRHGGTPIQVLDETGLLGPRTLLAHAVHLSDSDLALVARCGSSVAHCPASNLKLASGVARVADLMAADVNVALGTDGTASGNDIDLFLAGRLAAYVAKATGGDASAVPARTVLRMQTMAGARGLGIDHLVGSLEVGKRADVVVLDGRSPALTPSFDPTSTVAYAASRADVRWVVIDGRIVLDDGDLCTIDVMSTLDNMRRLVPRVAAGAT
jgi:5-methylthioadenosine/S-adenosylhomocysteine deaminase